MHPSQERTEYHLVNLTSYHTGVVEFMESSERVNIVRARVRTATKPEQKGEPTGMCNLFADEAAPTQVKVASAQMMSMRYGASTFIPVRGEWIRQQ